MFASRTLIATAAAVIVLLGCGSGKDQQAPVDALSLGLPGTSTPTANWTLDGVPCTLIPVPAAAPFGTGTCPGVRPGAIVLTDVGQCTLNFLFQGSDGSRYIGTAGHCILGTSPFGGDVGEMSWAPGTGPVARDSAGNPIGEFAYAILQDPKDFSLIRLDPLVEASAAMCHFGGPTAVNDDRPGLTELVVLNWFGNGVGVGAVLPARSAVAAGMPSPDHVFAQGVAAPGAPGRFSARIWLCSSHPSSSSPPRGPQALAPESGSGGTMAPDDFFPDARVALDRSGAVSLPPGGAARATTRVSGAQR